MTVINPSSISGITSITMPSGSNVLTIHTTDGAEKFRIDSSGNVKVGSACTISPDGDVFFTGVCTATTLAGSGANLTALPAANLTGALPAISGANLTGIAATDNVRTGILEVAGIATFSSDVKIGAAVTISESGIEASGIGITVANINGGAISGRRNMIINGAMQIAQRDTSFTADGNYTLDRWKVDDAMSAGAATITQSTTSPDGFSNSLKVDITSADTSVAAGEYSQVYQYIEAQNLQQLAYGTSAAKTVTLSFYVRSNKTGNYNVGILQDDASSRLVSLQYTINSADTWERKSLTIPGDASGQINNDNGIGYSLFWGLAYGTTYTSGSLQSSFSAYSSANFAAGQAVNLFDSTSNEWYITGVQLELGSQATPFEHRSYGEELTLCQRYYQIIAKGSDGTAGARSPLVSGQMWGTGAFYGVLPFKTKMRAIPSLDVVNGTDYWQVYNQTTDTCDTLAYNNASPDAITLHLSGNLSGTAYIGAWSRTNNAAAFAAAKAEL